MNEIPQSDDQTAIRDAIDRSINHDEIAHLTINGDSGDALVAIDSLTDSDTTEIDYVMSDHDGVDIMDVWAWLLSDDDDDTMIWRLSIRFKETTQ